MSFGSYRNLILFGIIFGSFIPARGQEGKWVAPPWADTLRNEVPVSKETISEGHSVYSRICAQCHGYLGRGDGPVSGTLKVKPANHSTLDVQRQSDGAIFWKISEGRGAMAPYKTALTTRQRWMLVNYIRTLKAE